VSVEPKVGPLFMVFDVESIGLHGEGFAVGWVVVRDDGVLVADGCLACPTSTAHGDDEGRQWVSENCPILPTNCPNPQEVRRLFWNYWSEWKAQGAVMVADCAWPVEARFLIACVNDDASRTWGGPYPLHELASFMVAAGMDPHATYYRLPDEPQHDPLGDARQSARLLVTALSKVGAA
jgi:hypothetical protein